jgi:C4-type Zn-finger protein
VNQQILFVLDQFDRIPDSSRMSKSMRVEDAPLTWHVRLVHEGGTCAAHGYHPTSVALCLEDAINNAKSFVKVEHEDLVRVNIVRSEAGHRFVAAYQAMSN